MTQSMIGYHDLSTKLLGSNFWREDPIVLVLVESLCYLSRSAQCDAVFPSTSPIRFEFLLSIVAEFSKVVKESVKREYSKN